MTDLKRSRTKENLMRAFAGESQARNRYTFAAGMAKAETPSCAAGNFSLYGRSGKEHAEIFTSFCRRWTKRRLRLPAGIR